MRRLKLSLETVVPASQVLSKKPKRRFFSVLFFKLFFASATPHVSGVSVVCTPKRSAANFRSLKRRAAVLYPHSFYTPPLNLIYVFAYDFHAEGGGFDPHAVFQVAICFRSSAGSHSGSPSVSKHDKKKHKSADK